MPTEHLGEALPEVVNAARVHGLLGTAEHFDVVHDHTLAGPLLAPGRQVPTVVTVHGPTGDLGDVYRPLASKAHLVAISQAQRRSAPDLNWVGTVHNGIDVEGFPFNADKGDYVVFLGRYHPDKAPHLAIAAARRAGVRIVLAGKCSEPVERDYYAAEIAPLLGDDAEDFGIAEGTAKGELLAGARCMVFPIQWDEPFGMVLAESLACGTPVVALDAGSVPEVVDDGRTGIVVHRPEDLGRAIREVDRLDPADCRREAEERFSTGAMTGGYVTVYDAVLSRDTA
jgi:glycosyltransferase involved in cell wall biosynthesis